MKKPDKKILFGTKQITSMFSVWERTEQVLTGTNKVNA